MKVLIYSLISLIFLVSGCSSPTTTPKDTTPPATPTRISALTGDQKISLSWAANSESDLASYTLHYGTDSASLTGNITISAPATTTELSSLTNGTAYFFNLDAVDRAGNHSASSATQSATPHASVVDTTAPILLSSVPSSGATAVALDSPVVLIFSEAMNPTTLTLSSTPAISFGPVNLSESGTKANFTPLSSLSAGTSYTLTLSGQDLATNSLGETTLSFTTLTPTDSTAPTVSSTAPVAGSSAVPTPANISISFSEPMKRSTTEAALSVSSGVACSFIWSADDSQLTCDPTTDMTPTTIYTVNLAASATDRAGNALATGLVFSFTTASVPDITAPSLVNNFPSDGATGIYDASGEIPFDSIKMDLRFSEAMDHASTETAFSTNIVGLTGSFGWSFDSTEMTFTPSAALGWGTNVTWTLANTATDQAGNPIASQTGSFRIARQSSKLLFSEPDLDGEVYSTGTFSTSFPDIYIGDDNTNLSSKGFLSFNLGDLPADSLAIYDATLSIYQISHTGNPYGLLGNLVVDSLDYGNGLDATDFDLSGQLEAVLSTDTTVGYKFANVYKAVRNNFALTVPRTRSQFRLRFETLVSTNANPDRITIGSGNNSGDDLKPGLFVTYVFP